MRRRSSTLFCPPISVKTWPAVSKQATAQQASFATRLLAWWDQNGRHDLPWQEPRSPYRVWLSEVMLQQTQVTTVIPYFFRFLEHFPTLKHLAQASQDDVLAQWSGLGYYSRGRNLHKTAQRVMDEYQGQLPDDPEILKQLPGIGESTANAIVSQAFDRVLPILDGNVKRVMARHQAITGWSGQSAVQKQMWQAATERLPTARGADYTQAVMDLGATLCKSRRPLCPQCPVSADCQAYLSDRVSELPERKPKKTVPEKHAVFLLATHTKSGGSTELLLHRRPGQGIWAGLWCLPQWDHLAALKTELEGRGYDSHGYTWARFEHRFTHYKLNAEIWRIDNAHSMHNTAQVAEEDSRWISAEAGLELGLPQPIRQVLVSLHQSIA